MNPSPAPQLPTASRLIAAAAAKEEERTNQLRRMVTTALQGIVTEMNLPNLQRLAEALSTQAGAVAALPDLYMQGTAQVIEAQRRFKRTLLWCMVTAIVAILSMGAALSWTMWRLHTAPESQSAMIAEMEAQSAKRATLAAQLAQMESETQALTAQRDGLQSQVRGMEVRSREQQESLRQLAENVRAMGQARESATAELAQLQRISQAFQFRLLEGRDGAVFVEVPTNSEPFYHGGKRLISVTPTH